MSNELHRPLHISLKKGIGTQELYIVLCRNKTILFITVGHEIIKRTGEMLSAVHSGKNLLTITYEKRVKRIGAHAKQKKVQFDSSADVDTFLAAFTTTSISESTTGIRKIGERAQIRIWVGTYNMGNGHPNENFSSYISSAKQSQPDLIIFGAQEADFGQNSAESVFGLISAELNTEYTMIVERAFWQIRLCVYVAKSLEGSISNVFASHEATGILNLMGNKGAVLATFTVLGSPIAVISAHLNAHQGNLERRNEDFKQIVRDIAPKDLLTSYHHIIWAGDLNYRIDLPMDTVISDAASSNYMPLVAADQLKRQMQLGKSFNGFSEGEIAFNPTYKYKRGTTSYNIESKRIPAWCDRVLIRSFPGLEKKCLEYRDYPSVLTSDHIPIYALWSLEVAMPKPPPPPFASFIGIRPFFEFHNLSIDIGAPIEKVNLSFESSFLSKTISTATGKGRKRVDFPDECVPIIVPDSYFSATYLRTLFLRIVVSVNERTGVTILPLSFGISEVFRPFSELIEYKLEKVGKISGEMKIVSASDAIIREHQTRHGKAGPTFLFESKKSRLEM